MNKRGKKKFVAKRKHKKYTYMKNLIHVTVDLPGEGIGMISGFIQYLMDHDPSRVPPIYGFGEYPIREFRPLEEEEKSKLSQRLRMDCEDNFIPCDNIISSDPGTDLVDGYIHYMKEKEKDNKDE